MTETKTCPAITVGYDVLLKADRVWSCGQREGHPGDHNELAPRGCGCTAWADHCSTCAEHTCRCQSGDAA